METRLKVLISAYACEPDRGSEPEVGWRWVLEMSKHHDITVVTRANNQAVIEAALPHLPGPHPSFLYYDPPRWTVWLKKHGLPVALYYALWQMGVRRHVAARLREFDLIHHITFNSFRQPGFWWGTGKPVVLGPLGGGQICPWPFLATFGTGRFGETLRSLSVMASVWLPHLHLCFKSASVILTANRETTARIPRRFQHKVRSMLETAVSESQIQPPLPARPTSSIRFIWVSRLEKIKACSLVLEAIAIALEREPGLRLSVVGPGPDEAELKAQAQRLGIAESVTFQGRVPRNDIPALLREHDAFIFSSVRDTSGNVLLEAMAAGLPAITLKHHGAAEIATDETAIRVRVTSVDQSIAGIADAMVQLARSPDLRQTLAHSAHQRMRELFTWERKGQQMAAFYRQTGNPKPG